MSLIIDSLLVGFGIYSIIFCLFRVILEKRGSQLILNIDKLASIVFAIGGLLFFGQILFNLIGSYTSAIDELEKYSLLNRMFGPYWFVYWLQPILYLISTQILWIKRVRLNRLLRFLIGLLMLISFEKLIIMITSLHRDYLPSLWITPVSIILINWTTYMGIFVLIVGCVYLIEQKILNRKTV